MDVDHITSINQKSEHKNDITCILIASFKQVKSNFKTLYTNIKIK